MRKALQILIGYARQWAASPRQEADVVQPKPLSKYSLLMPDLAYYGSQVWRLLLLPTFRSIKVLMKVHSWR